MVQSTLIYSLALVAQMISQGSTVAIPKADLTVRDNELQSRASTGGFAWLGCFCATQDAGKAFSSVIGRVNFGTGSNNNLNPQCANFCREKGTQYYSVIDYPGQCACGNSLNTSLTYTTTQDGCGHTGQNKLDYMYSGGPGFVGDYYYGCTGVYSVVF